MVPTTPPPSLPPPPLPGVGPTTTRSLASRRTALAVVPVVAAGVAALLGFGFAYLFIGPGSLRSDNGWDSLAAAILFVLVGGFLTAVGYVVAATAAVARLQPAGARLAPVVVAVAAPVALAAVIGSIGSRPAGTLSSLGAALVLFGTVAGLPVLLWVAGRLAPARWLVAPAAAIVVGLAATATGAVLA